MLFLRAAFRGLIFGLVVLGTCSLGFAVMTWLHLENDPDLARWLPLIAALIAVLGYRLSSQNVPKEDRKYVSLVIPALIFMPLTVGIVSLVDLTHEATSANIPDWLRESLFGATLFGGLVAMVEWARLRYPVWKERGESE